MIQLEKLDSPTILEENKEEWTEEYIGRLDGEDEGNPTAVLQRLKREEIRSSLKDETAEKCMYCEGTVGDVTYSRIEHIDPKSEFPKKSFEWENLGLACERCNTEKGDSYFGDISLLNPFEDSPSEFLVAEGPMIRPKLQGDRGRRTVSELKLNRSKLLENRKRKIDELHDMVELALAARDERRKMLLKQAEEMAKADKEFSFIAKAFLNSVSSKMDWDYGENELED